MTATTDITNSRRRRFAERSRARAEALREGKCARCFDDSSGGPACPACLGTGRAPAPTAAEIAHSRLQVDSKLVGDDPSAA